MSPTPTNNDLPSKDQPSKDQPSKDRPSNEDGSAEEVGPIKALFPRKAIRWAGVAMVFLAGGGLVAGLVLFLGLPDLGAVSPHNEGTGRIMHGAFERSVSARAEDLPEDIDLDDPGLVQLGAGHYSNVCANCHGAPGLGQNPIALSMRPEPPTLFEASERYSPGELFRILHAGARFSAMPAWPVSNRPDEVWAMVAFLLKLPTMEHNEYVRLANGPTASTANWSVQTSRTNIEENSREPRPYTPGDPQSFITTDEGTLLPAVGFAQASGTGELAGLCVGCHGENGAGRKDGVVPNLTLHSPEYLAGELREFATGERSSGIMWTVAANLSESDIETLSRKYGVATALPSLGPRVSGEDRAELIAQGGKYALEGVLEEGAEDVPDDQPKPTKVQSCNGCHVEVAKTDPTMPGIAGQNEAYLRGQMWLFQKGVRGIQPMGTVSHNLTGSQIDALAAYFASLPPKKAAIN